LVKSNHCQPAIFVTSAVCCRALRRERKTLAIQSTAGLSLGEWAALWLAESVSFEEALRILEARGRFIQEACEEHAGAMLSVIGLDPEKLKAVAAAAGVEIANYNSPEQTVLSGAREGIQAAEKLVKEAGAKRAIMLNVAGAYHSALMASAAQRLEAFIRDRPIRPPCLPVISNVTGQPHGTPDDIRRQMVLQVTSPVQWVACVQTLQQQGVTRYIECGPGRVLSGLVKRIHPEAELCNVQDCPSLTKTIADLEAREA
jgi:[acyl-carrier-protein] S-malonyltransferase